MLRPDGSAGAGLTIGVGVQVKNGQWKDRFNLRGMVRNQPNWVMEVETDESGRFSAVLPPEKVCHFMRIRCETSFAAPYATERLPVKAGDLGEIRLDKGFAIKGRSLMWTGSRLKE